MGLSHCESPVYKISLGYCGPTDCCLALEYERKPGVFKEYKIESTSWRILSQILREAKVNADPGLWVPQDTYHGRTLELLWDCGDSDLMDKSNTDTSRFSLRFQIEKNEGTCYYEPYLHDSETKKDYRYDAIPPAILRDCFREKLEAGNALAHLIVSFALKQAKNPVKET